jgi:hypothetical protein
VLARPPELEQLVDALLGLLLRTPALGAGDVLRVRSAVRAQDLAHALARHAEAQRDLVQAPALFAQRLHPAHALQRSGHERARVASGGIEHARQSRGDRLR